MLRLLILTTFACVAALPAAAESEIQSIVSYDCNPNKCDLKCWGAGGTLELQYSNLSVFQFKDHPRRLWLGVNDAHYVLADDYSCIFKGRPTFRLTVSPLGPPPAPPRVCIGNVCY